ncbi:MAG TPA: NAD-dependent epimerase/dehydratase family protein [Dissulfurispiraceae bacterium]|nr:NAD-dependent epimerase/dehydratase family protein [Dissulfurispiraceae bacterium]
MRALVTGATGFIGSHLTEALVREGFDVTCLVRDPSKAEVLEGLNVRIAVGDCLKRESLDGAVADADFVFHVAGLTKSHSPEQFHAVNVLGTENVLDAVSRNSERLRRFVHVSSLAAAGPCRNEMPLTEVNEPKPVSVYGKSKLDGENAVRARKDELPVTIIRPPAVYGPRDRDMLVFFKMVKSGIFPYWGKCFYSFIYVDDLVRGLIMSALSREAEGETFFLSDGNMYSTDEIFSALSLALQRKPLKVLLPRCILTVLGRLTVRTGSASIMNADKFRELMFTRWLCDARKAAVRLNFVPGVDLQKGMKWTADWYRIHRWL